MDYAKKLKAMGAVNVLVSLGAEGAVLIDEFEREHFLSAPSGILVNSVGSGDSMVSGFLAGYLETQNYASALALSVAAGSASAFSPWLASKENIINMQRRL